MDDRQQPDSQERHERLEEVAPHEVRPTDTVGGGVIDSGGTARETGTPDSDRLAALPEHERPGPATGIGDYQEMVTGERRERIERESDRDDADELPPVNRSG